MPANIGPESPPPGFLVESALFDQESGQGGIDVKKIQVPKPSCSTMSLRAQPQVCNAPLSAEGTGDLSP